MANVEEGLKELDRIEMMPGDGICTLYDLRKILEAMREPALPVDDRAITRGQSDAITRRQTELFKQINDIQSIVSGTKRKWRDEVDRRLNVLEGKELNPYPETGNITKDNNNDLVRMMIGNTAEPCVHGCGCKKHWNEGKRTIEIDREIATYSIKMLERNGLLMLASEIKRALAEGK